MRQATAAALLALLGVLAPPAFAAAPPIACGKARQPVDRLICGSPELMAMDREVTALYDRGMASFAPGERHVLAESQLAYLARRRGCAWASHHSAHPGVAVEECTRNAIDGRLRRLRVAVDRGRL